MQYAHEYCLCEWIKRKINFKSKAKVNCQVCDQPFEYKINKRLFFSWEQLKVNYQRCYEIYRCFFIMMSILLVVWLSFVTLIAIGLAQSDGGWVKSHILFADQTRIIFLCIILVYFLIMVFVSLLFVAQYGVKTEYLVKNMQNYTKKNRRIVSKLYSIAT